jgi:hypothetical protein
MEKSSITTERRVTRTITVILIVLFIATYLVAKFDFVVSFGSAGYIRHHSVFWLVGALIALTILVVDRISSRS